MNKTRSFNFLAYMTYAPLPLLGIMVLFYAMGKLMQVGWLESAPDVLMIPTFIAYFISLFMGTIYGLLKKEDSVYLMAIISLAVWVMIYIFKLFSLPREAMIAVNIVILGALGVLHIMQYRATKKWESRLVVRRQE
jgi:lipoprotein signal peptidase